MEQTEARVAAALSAGGHVVRDGSGPPGGRCHRIRGEPLKLGIRVSADPSGWSYAEKASALLPAGAVPHGASSSSPKLTGAVDLGF